MDISEYYNAVETRKPSSDHFFLVCSDDTLSNLVLRFQNLREVGIFRVLNGTVFHADLDLCLVYCSIGCIPVPYSPHPYKTKPMALTDRRCSLILISLSCTDISIYSIRLYMLAVDFFD